jgi:selenocysteine lyase/cysteine desulfurase
MPNFPAIYAIRAALEYITSVGPAQIEEAARPLVHACLDGLEELPVELLTPREPESLAGIVAFRHPQMERLHSELAAEQIHVMHSSGRLRVSIHGYNCMEDVDHLLSVLRRILR